MRDAVELAVNEREQLVNEAPIPDAVTRRGLSNV